MTAKVLGLAWHEDRDYLSRVCDLGDSTESDFEFDFRFWSQGNAAGPRLVRSGSLYVQPSHVEDRLLDILEDLEPTVFLVFHGPRGASSSEFMGALIKAAGWATLRGLPTYFAFVRSFQDNFDQGYGRFFRAGRAFRTCEVCDPTLSADAQQAHRAKLRDELHDALRFALEADSDTAKVGIGVLLVSNQDGSIHLAERFKRAEEGKIGTIGGQLPLKDGIEETLLRLVEKRFGDADFGRFRLGPLLACTNMPRRTDDNSHFVDLTFLATVDRKPPLARPTRDYRPIGDDERIWFSLAEMGAFCAQGRLIRPVENAYRALARLVAGHALAQGGRGPLSLLEVFAEPGVTQLIEKTSHAAVASMIEDGGLAPVEGHRLLFETRQ